MTTSTRVLFAIAALMVVVLFSAAIMAALGLMLGAVLWSEHHNWQKHVAPNSSLALDVWTYSWQVGVKFGVLGAILGGANAVLRAGHLIRPPRPFMLEPHPPDQPVP